MLGCTGLCDPLRLGLSAAKLVDEGLSLLRIKREGALCDVLGEPCAGEDGKFAVAAFVNPIFDRLPGDGGLAARSDGARLLGRVMPFWYIGSVVLGVAWSSLAWGDAEAGLVATALLVVGLVISARACLRRERG